MSEAQIIQDHVNKLAHLVFKTQSGSQEQHMILRDDMNKLDDKLASLHQTIKLLLQAGMGEDAPRWTQAVAARVLKTHGAALDADGSRALASPLGFVVETPRPRSPTAPFS